MKQIECPICNEMHDEDAICPRCSFEIHQFFTPSPHFEAIENERKETHEKWWRELNEQKVDRTQYEEIEQELNAANSRISELEQELEKGKKPIAFLISEQQVVYCLYEGKNTFGSAKINSNCDQHQKIILPGLSVRPVHFSILITTIENRKRCIINEVGGEVSTLYINSTTNTVVNDTQLSDGDEITVSINHKDSKIKFRININK